MTETDVVTSERVATDDCHGWFFEGLGPDPGPGVLVLHGAGGPGGYELEYARHLAHHGYSVLCPAYFDAPGAPDVLEAVPLELFERAADALRGRGSVAGDRIGIVGFSRGGEAALLVGSELDGVGAVVSYVGSAYVFPAPTWMDGVEAEGPAWTRAGEPVPYVPIEPVEVDQPDGEAVLEVDDGVAVRAVELAEDARVERARTPVERIDGPLLCVTGGRDRAWRASDLVEVAMERLADADRPWDDEHRHYPDAGHAIRVPYDPTGTDPDVEHRYGGTNAANARASALAWSHALRTLGDGLGRREA